MYLVRLSRHRGNYIDKEKNPTKIKAQSYFWEEEKRKKERILYG